MSTVAIPTVVISADQHRMARAVPIVLIGITVTAQVADAFGVGPPPLGLGAPIVRPEFMSGSHAGVSVAENSAMLTQIGPGEV